MCGFTNHSDLLQYVPYAWHSVLQFLHYLPHYTPNAVRGRSGGGLTPLAPRTAQLIVKFGEKVLQIDYRCCK